MTAVTWRTELVDRIQKREARVAVVGLGYVGLPLALRAVEAGFDVTGIDVDESRLDAIANGRSYLDDVTSADLEDAISTGRFHASDDFAVVDGTDVVLVAVPTPLKGDVPDLSAVLSAADALAPHLHPGMLISLESTTFPGTTEEIVRPRLENQVNAGPDFALVFSPERIDPGNQTHQLRDIPKIVGGVTPACAEVAEAFYSTIVSKVVVVRRAREAEMAKLLENTYRQVNIALANEFAMVAHELDIDIWEVIEAAATKPFGFQPFYPGVGIGGHCIAVDPVYLTWRIRELGRAPFRLVELAREVDTSMPTYIAKRIGEALIARDVLASGANVLALGVTYKPDVGDVRESRAIDVLRELKKMGVNVSYNDPFVAEVDLDGTTLSCAELEPAIEEADLVAILTHHSAYAWHDIVSGAKAVFDARGVTRGIDSPNISRL